jgi:choline dehydrogenase-like flavoprotein
MEHQSETRPKTAKYNAHYVIIGGGTASLVLTSRLTESRAIQVIVLEAGEN